MRKQLTKHIVIDTEICHGKPTFAGTRIMVWQVLRQLSRGLSWEQIEKEWQGKITPAGISEALELAQHYFAGQEQDLLTPAS